MSNEVHVPLPFKEKKRDINVEVNDQLFSEVKKEIERRQISIRSAVEWGLSAFLVHTNPKAAKKLKITGDPVARVD